jgi:hypothetical protein
MKKLINVRLYYVAILLISLSLSSISNAQSKKSTEFRTVKTAFQTIQNALFTIEETRNYCNSQFSEDSVRNSESFEEWESKYSFFLNEFDKNYARWKLGFSDLEQQQFAGLEFTQRQIIRESIVQDYAEGGRDKCYNFKPSLSRPRNNLELTFQSEFNLIRNQTFNGFMNARGDGTGAEKFCAWQQEQALKIITERDAGKDIKSQKNQLNEFNAKADSSVNKKQQALRTKTLNEMIDEAYQAPSILSLSFSQYRFSLCERDFRNMKTDNFKTALPLILECQSKSPEYSDLLGQCISQALVKK